MSSGVNPQQWPNPPAPSPAPAVQPATPVVNTAPIQVQKTWDDRLWDLAKVVVPSLIFAVTTIMVNRGLLTKADADAINKAVPLLVSSNDPNAVVDVTQSVDGRPSTVKVTTTPVKVADGTPTPADVTPPAPSDDLKKILDRLTAVEEQQANQSTAIQKLLNPPAPKPVDPDHTPIPSVDPTKPVIVVTDASGKVITDSSPGSKPATIEANKPVKVLATRSVKWTEDASNPSDVFLLDFPNGYSCTLTNGASVTFTAGYPTASGEVALVKVKLLSAAQPPPNPTPTPIDPEVKPKPKPSGDLKVVIIYESEQNHTRQQDLILASALSGKISDVLTAKCSKGPDGRPNFRRWDQNLEVDKTSTMGSLFNATLKAAQSKGLPSAVVSCGDDQTIYPIPPDATEDQVIQIITCGAN